MAPNGRNFAYLARFYEVRRGPHAAEVALGAGFRPYSAEQRLGRSIINTNTNRKHKHK